MKYRIHVLKLYNIFFMDEGGIVAATGSIRIKDKG